MTATYDFDLRGFAGIRLVDARSEDRDAVAKQLGLPCAEDAISPDLTIRFVDRLELREAPRLLGLGETGYTSDSFLILRGRHKSRTRVALPFDRIGDGCEIVCERGVLAVPLVVPIINLSLLAKGSLALHACAFSYGGSGWVSTGWSKGGKTETLLGFMARGARYIGDEWVYFDADGSRMAGLPEPIRVWRWHLDSLPMFRRALRRGERSRLRALGVMAGGMRRFGRVSTVRRARPLVEKQLCVDIPPDRLFGASSCAAEGTPEKILFVTSHDSPDIVVEPVDAATVADRMVASLQYEQMHFLSHYRAFRFAFPDRASDVVERSEELQRTALRRILSGKEAYEVRHPYPFDIPALVDAIESRCAGS